MKPTNRIRTLLFLSCDDNFQRETQTHELFGRSLNPSFGNHYQSRCHRGHQQLGSWPKKFIYFLINWRAQILASDNRFAVAAARVLNRSSNRSRLIIFQLEMLICSFQAIIRSNFLASCSVGGNIVLLGWFFLCWLPWLLANKHKMKSNCQSLKSVLQIKRPAGSHKHQRLLSKVLCWCQ